VNVASWLKAAPSGECKLNVDVGNRQTHKQMNIVIAESPLQTVWGEAG